MSRAVSNPDNEIMGAQRFLYENPFGRLLLKGVLVRRWVSRLAGAYMSCRLSTAHIKGFIRKNAIDMSDYPTTKYKSFNDFFARRIKADARPVDGDPEALIAPCDARLSAYRVTEESRFCIKGGSYSLASLLDSERLASRFAGGVCLIFRLAVDNYHRYCYIDDGVQGVNVAIGGGLHTVHNIALKVSNIYKTNSREYCVLRTEHFGDVVEVEVGAMMVGRIRNAREDCSFKRGEEKGWFEFGGSTVVLLLQKDAATIDEEFFLNTGEGLETLVKQGEKIGNAAKQQMKTYAYL